LQLDPIELHAVSVCVTLAVATAGMWVMFDALHHGVGSWGFFAGWRRGDGISASIADIGEGGSNPAYVALFKELRRFGYIEGVNLVVTRYSGEGREERFPDLCQEV
jgi:hypothetical protein